MRRSTLFLPLILAMSACSAAPGRDDAIVQAVPAGLGCAAEVTAAVLAARDAGQDAEDAAIGGAVALLAPDCIVTLGALATAARGGAPPTASMAASHPDPPLAVPDLPAAR